VLQHLQVTKRKVVAFEWAVFALEQIRDWFYESLGAVPMDEWAVYRLVRATAGALADEQRSSIRVSLGIRFVQSSHYGQ
jgi:hypothetical protein